MTVVPPAFAEDIERRFGVEGTRWIAELDRHLEILAARWALDVGGPLGFGTWSVVYGVTQAGRPAALKLTWPDDARHDREVSVLRLWNGDGAAEVLAEDRERHPLLLERLDPEVRLSRVPVADALHVAGTLLRRHAHLAPPGLPTLDAVTRELLTTLEPQWERLRRPMPHDVIVRARRFATDLLPGIDTRVVNWDLHGDNILRGSREPWQVIDPQVVAGDVEYGVAQLLWWRLEDIEARGGVSWALELLARAATLDATRLIAWVYVRTVAYWLSGLEGGLTLDPERCRRLVAALDASAVPKLGAPRS